MPGSAAATPTLAADSLLEHERVQDLVHEVHPPSDAHFTIEEIRGNDKLICFYTGFSSYKILLSFFQFLGPAVYELNYWGSKTSVHEPRKRKRLRKISPLNQFFMTLVKLRLNLKDSRSGLSFWGLRSFCFKVHNHMDLFYVPTSERSRLDAIDRASSRYSSSHISREVPKYSMPVRYIWRHQQTFACSRQPGAAISITIL